jgi:hypothetical protein
MNIGRIGKGQFKDFEHTHNVKNKKTSTGKQLPLSSSIEQQIGYMKASEKHNPLKGRVKVLENGYLNKEAKIILPSRPKNRLG